MLRGSRTLVTVVAIIGLGLGGLVGAAGVEAQEATPETAGTPIVAATPDAVATPVAPGGAATPVAAAEQTVTLTDADGSEVGTATFSESDAGVTVSLSIEGLEPGEYGWHLHAVGMCDPAGLEPFSTAGPHWNPTGAPHAGPEDPVKHAGDFGNLSAGDSGPAEGEITLDSFTLSEGPTSVNDADGTAIIVHLGTDDLVSQPSGNSGARYACGVVAEPMSEGSVQEASAQGNLTVPAAEPFTEALLEQLQAPEGFEISVYASGLSGPRMLAISPDGVLYVSETAANTVRALSDTDGDGVMDAAVPVAVNLPLVHGIAFHEDQVYLAGSQTVWVADVQDDGSFANLDVLIDSLPDGGQHPRRTIAIGADDMLYLSLGSSCNACAETNPMSATMVQSNLDGSNLVIFATGLRNTLGWDWDPETGLMWGMDQGSDWRGDEQPPEELNQIIPAGNYGWPYCFGNQEVDLYLPYPPAGADPEQYCANTEAPVLTYQAHSSPIGFLFYTADQFPADYQGDAFVTMRGSWNRGEPTGYKVVRIQFEDGQPVGFEDFVTGWLMDDGQSHFGRIAGLVTAPDGSLLVADDTNGVIYLISYSE